MGEQTMTRDATTTHTPEVHWVKRTQHERKRSTPNRMLCTFYPWI